MIVLTLFLSTLSVLLSILGIVIYQWVTIIPQLGYKPVYYIRQIQVGVGVISITTVIVGLILTPSVFGWVSLFLVLLLTPLSGATHATRFLVALDNPKHGKVSEVSLADSATVVGLELNGRAQAWAVETLFPHHIANDDIGGVALSACW